MRLYKKTIAVLLLLAVLLCGGCVKHTHIVMESRLVGDFHCSFFEDGTVEITAYRGSDSELKLPASVEEHRVIGFGMKAFDGCEGLSAVFIPPTVVSLPAKLFNSCPSLERVYIPASVTAIGKNVIFECPQFSTVLYGGSEQQWKNVNVGSVPWTDNYVLINAQFVYEYDMGG